MQEIRSSNAPVVTGICDPNESGVRLHRSLKLGSKLKYLNIFLLIVRFVKSSDQTIIQIIRKNKSILMFLINPSNCFTGMY